MSKYFNNKNDKAEVLKNRKIIKMKNVINNVKKLVGKK